MGNIQYCFVGFLFHMNGSILSPWPVPEPLLSAAHFKIISRHLGGRRASPISEQLGKPGVLGTRLCFLG